MAKEITQCDVEKAQKRWAKAIVKIGRVYMTKGDLDTCARKNIRKLYAYDDGGTVLFKPTKCKVEQFRPTLDGAVSYFVGHEFARTKKKFSEDGGFAIAPYVAVRFVNHDIIYGKDRAIAMGNYFFTSLSGVNTKVEYTFGYRWRDDDLVIDLHHSSLPFTG